MRSEGESGPSQPQVPSRQELRVLDDLGKGRCAELGTRQDSSPRGTLAEDSVPCCSTSVAANHGGEGHSSAGRTPGRSAAQCHVCRIRDRGPLRNSVLQGCWLTTGDSVNVRGSCMQYDPGGRAWSGDTVNPGTGQWYRTNEKNAGHERDTASWEENVMSHAADPGQHEGSGGGLVQPRWLSCGKVGWNVSS